MARGRTRRVRRTHSSTPTSKQSLTGPLLVGGAVLGAVYFLARRSGSAAVLPTPTPAPAPGSNPLPAPPPSSATPPAAPRSTLTGPVLVQPRPVPPYAGGVSPAVRVLQGQLNALGHNAGTEDGVLGAQTNAAMDRFLAANNATRASVAALVARFQAELPGTLNDSVALLWVDDDYRARRGLPVATPRTGVRITAAHR